jgi:hypothetical protein
MLSPLIGGSRAAEVRAKSNPVFQRQAYSDDGYGRKQRSGALDPATKQIASGAPIA